MKPVKSITCPLCEGYGTAQDGTCPMCEGTGAVTKAEHDEFNAREDMKAELAFDDMCYEADKDVEYRWGLYCWHCGADDAKSRPDGTCSSCHGDYYPPKES